MCGIAGCIGTDDITTIELMLDSLSHRGPDDRGIHSFGKNVFGHTRLSIIDVAKGHQPILTNNGKSGIICNGEIYNYQAIRQKLVSKYSFKTVSDSEVILHLYREKGPDCVNDLDGMFAFALYDEDTFMLARDHIGIKPLYYGYKDDNLYFSSELGALSLSGVREINEFPCGHYYTPERGFVQYYQVPLVMDHPEIDIEYTKELIRSTLTEAVKKRLLADKQVHVGAFCSGGLDSSLITAIAASEIPNLHTFSVGIEGSRDLEAARRVSQHLNTIHHEYTFTTDEVLRKLPEIIYYLESFDQDLVRSAIPCFFVSRLASEYVKVILTGEGADELFAGYTYYKDMNQPDKTLNQELHRSVSSLHNINLQRVDRLTMAHSIEGRVPFLDIKMIEVALSIPPKYKLYKNEQGALIEKWILREAFKDLLPQEIIWRDKEQFDEGSGTTDLLDRAIDETMPQERANEYRQLFPKTLLRSDEECYYHRLFMEVIQNPDPVLANVARWSERNSM